MQVKKAVIPAAGYGTRMLPLTKALPKEFVPIVDKPSIQFLVEEAAASGIEDVLIIVSRGKELIESHFDRCPELETKLEKGGKAKQLELSLIHISFAEVYVNDAFGTSHRAHASTAGVTKYLPAVCGYLLQKEIDVMGGALDNLSLIHI